MGKEDQGLLSTLLKLGVTCPSRGMAQWLDKAGQCNGGHGLLGFYLLQHEGSSVLDMAVMLTSSRLLLSHLL